MQPSVVEIMIPGPPIAKMRHRHFSRGGFVSTYDPQTSEKKSTQLLVKSLLSRDAFSGNLKVRIDVFLPIAKSLSIKKKNHYLWGYCETQKPDLDNIAKFYLDAGNGIIWRDDSQITSLILKKSYSDKPRTVIMVEEQMESLDEGAKEILGLVSPDDFNDIMQLVSQYGEILKKSSPGHEQLWAPRAAILLSKLADKYSTQLSKIKKQQPNYWQKPRFGEGYPQC